MPAKAPPPSIQHRYRVSFRASLALLCSLGLFACQPLRPTAPTATQPNLATSPQAAIDLQLIEAMQAQGAWRASLANIHAYRQAYGDSPRLQVLTATALRGNGQLTQAQAMYHQLLHSSAAAAAWHGLGELLSSQAGPNSEALHALGQACQLAPQQAEYWTDLGFAYLQRGALNDAAGALQQAQRLAPNQQRNLSGLAILAWIKGEPAQAQQWLQRGSFSNHARKQLQQTAAAWTHPAKPSPTPTISTAQPSFPAPMLDRFASPTAVVP